MLPVPLLKRVCGFAALVFTISLLGLRSAMARGDVLEPGMGHEVIVVQTQYGDLHIGLFPQEAPQTVAHILKLVELGAYNTNHMEWLSHNLAVKVLSVHEHRQVPLSEIQKMEAEKTVPLEPNGLSNRAGYLTMVRRDDVDSATSSFMILLQDAPHLNGRFTVFGKVMRGMEVLRREVLGMTNLRQIQIRSAHRYTVASRQLERCSEANVNYYLSDTWTDPIPLTQKCLTEHVREPIPFGRSRTVLMKGLPKMGTTWTEVLVGRLIEEVCNSGIYACKASTTSRGSLAAFADNRGARTGTALQWKCDSKHDFPMSKDPSSDAADGVGAFYAFDSGKLAGWEACLENRTYVDYETCLPSWNRPPDYEVWMDNRAHDLMRQHGPGWTIGDEAEQEKKYILVVRDPRDATVSLMHYHHDGADDAKLQQGTRQYVKHYTTWLGFWYWYQTRYAAKLYPTLVMVYRDMKENPAREYGRLLHFLGLKASVELVNRVVDETSFESMRKMEYARQLPGRNRAKGDNRKVRSGHAQGFYEELTAETISYCNGVMRDLLPPELNVHFDVQ